MDAADAAFDRPPPPYVAGGTQDAASEAVRQLGADNREAADGYEVPLSTLTRPRRQRRRRTRCGAGGFAPLAVYGFLALASVAAAAWNAWMALDNASEAERLWNKALSSCVRRPRSSELSRVVSSNGRAYADARVEGGSACMIDVAELLQEASQVGRKTTLTITTGSAHEQRAPNDGTEQSNNLQRVAKTLAHLGSAFCPTKEPDLSYAHVDRWLDDNRHGSIVTGNISNAGGGVTIGESGYYFVYSQVGYVLAARDAVEVSPFTDHKLMRRRARSNQSGGENSYQIDLLARAQKTRCWSSKSNCSMTSSYVGAVFQLDKGDVVTVDVDRVRYVWHSPQQTYIGAYLLTS